MTKVSTIQIDNPKFSKNGWRERFKPSAREASLSSTYQLQPGANVSANDLLQLHWVYDLGVVDMPPVSFYTVAGKRIVDVCIAGLVTIFILSWLIPVLGALIMCESRGSFLFIQARSGRKGRPFPCLKLRTMRQASHEHGFRQTARDDDRITPLGRFLRKTNLDEMPQFINVLIGDMSLVGPRPHAIPHDAQHWDSAAYRERYSVRPGITGLAQIKGARGAINQNQRMDHRVRFDHFYIPRQTFLFDMAICFWTVKLTVKGDKNAW